MAGIICAFSLSMRTTMLPPVMMLDIDAFRMLLSVPVTSVSPSLANLVTLLTEESVVDHCPRVQALASELATVRP